MSFAAIRGAPLIAEQHILPMMVVVRRELFWRMVASLGDCALQPAPRASSHKTYLRFNRVFAYSTAFPPALLGLAVRRPYFYEIAKRLRLTSLGETIQLDTVVYPV